MKSYIKFYFIVILILLAFCFFKTNFELFSFQSNLKRETSQDSSSLEGFSLKGLSQQEKERFLFREAFSRMDLDERLFIEGCWDQKMLNQRALTTYVLELDSQARGRVIKDVGQGYHPMEAIDVERAALDQKRHNRI